MITTPKRTAYRAPTATPAQFAAAAALLQPSSYSTASRDGARLVLVDGLSINAAARQCGVGAPSVLRAVRRLADIVVGGCPTCGHALGAPSGGRRDPAPSKGRRDPGAQAAQSPKQRTPAGGAPLQRPSETPPLHRVGETPPDADCSTGEPWLLAKPRQTRKPGPAAEAEGDP